MRPAAVLRVVHAPARTWERGTRDAVWRPWRREWRGDEKLAHAPAKRAASRVSLLAADTSEPSFNGGVALKPSRRALTRAPALALVPSRYACSYPPRAVGRTSRPSSVGRLENVTSYPQLQPPPSVTSVVPKQQPRVRRAASPLLRARRPETSLLLEVTAALLQGALRTLCSAHSSACSSAPKYSTAWTQLCAAEPRA